MGAKGLLRSDQQHGGHCSAGSGEEWCVHRPRTLPFEDEDKACHKSRCEDDVWAGDEGEGKASEDDCESLPRCCIEEADLEWCSAVALNAFPEVCPPWESHGARLGSIILALGSDTLQLVHVLSSC